MRVPAPVRTLVVLQDLLPAAAGGGGGKPPLAPFVPGPTPWRCLRVAEFGRRGDVEARFETEIYK